MKITARRALRYRKSGRDGLPAHVLRPASAAYFHDAFQAARGRPRLSLARDTQSTLDGGRGQRFCIAVTARSQAPLDAVRTAFARAGDKGLAPVAERFSERPVDLDFSAGAPKPVRREPLPLWLSIDDNFTAVLSTSEREDVALCKEFNWPYRVG